MRTALWLGLIVFLITCTSSKTGNEHEVADETKGIELARWIVGSWRNETSDATIYETWKVVNDSMFSGESYSIRHGDTVSSEVIKLVQRNDRLIYVPTVAGQNSGRAVEFISTSITGEKMVFENPDHDFPTMIRYERMSEDSILAEISGEVNGNIRSISFPMRRSE